MHALDESLLRGPGFEGNIKVATAAWMPTDTLRSYAGERYDPRMPAAKLRNPLRYSRGSILLGETDEEDPAPIGFYDDRHIVTIAGSRAGKGRSAIIPNLKFYPGSVVCIDPKGENAAKTVEDRAKQVKQGGLGQQVYVLDPFGVSGVPERYLASYNPIEAIDLSDIDAVEQIGAIADSLVVATDPRNAHWDNSARALIEALIAHVLTGDMRGRPLSLITVRELLLKGDLRAAAEMNSKEEQPSLSFPEAIEDGGQTADLVDPFEALIREMMENDQLGGIVSGQAFKLIRMGEEERGSVLSFAERNTKFLDGKPMATVLQRSVRTVDLRHLKERTRGIAIYLCLPSRYMGTHARWLRLIISAVLFAAERDRAQPKSGVPILTILDEFPILGNLSIVETGIGYMAGFGMKLWIVLQDINQLKRDYSKSWETFLGNAGVKQFFGNSDYSTLEYISKLLGETEIVRAQVETSTSKTNSKTTMSEFQRRLMASSTNKGKSKHGYTLDEMSDTQDSETESKNEREERVRTALMTPTEVSLFFSREGRRQIIISSGWSPMILKRADDDTIKESESTFLRERNQEPINPR